MNILYLANIRMPTERAHGVQIVKTCEALAALGHNVKLVVPRRRTAITEDPYAYYGIQENFGIIRMPCLDFVSYGRLGFWIETTTFSFASWWHVLRSRADVIYSRDEIPLLLASFAKGRCIWESHNGRYSWVVRALLRRGAQLVVISKGLRNAYVARGINPAKICVAPDAVDVNAFTDTETKEQARSRLGISTAKPIIMYIGSLGKEKGVETLCKAAGLIPSAEVVVIGGAGDEVVLYANRYPLVRFLGARPYAELPSNQQAADVLVIPNSGKYLESGVYTSPMKVFAHMTSGVPIVAAQVPALEEVLHAGNALLVPPDSSKDLARGICEVCEDPMQAQSRAKQAQLDVRQYTWQARALTLVRCIESVNVHEKNN